MSDEQRAEVYRVWERLVAGDAPPHEALDYVMESMNCDRRTALVYLRCAFGDWVVRTQPGTYWNLSAPKIARRVMLYGFGAVSVGDLRRMARDLDNPVYGVSKDEANPIRVNRVAWLNDVRKAGALYRSLRTL